MASDVKPKVRSRRIGQPFAQDPVPRGIGQQVGLTKDMILAAAKRSLATRPGPISIKAVAADLGVAHNSISVRFRREGTNLERELARDFLFGLSRPMLPGEDWRSFLRDLFAAAMQECEAHPGLARAVTLWIGTDPTLSADFTERVLYLLGSAGLSVDECQARHDVVLAGLAGMLAVQFPDFGSGPSKWANTVGGELAKVDPRRLPLLHRSRDALAAIAARKTSRAKKSTGSNEFAQRMADLLISSLEAGVVQQQGAGQTSRVKRAEKMVPEGGK